MKYDLIIIGFGKGGKTLAASIANEQTKVALIEKSPKMYGGTCINVACIPSKSLVKNAKQAEILGFETFAEKAAFYQRAIEEKDQVTSMLRQKNFAKLDNNPNVTVYTGTASFLSQKSIFVEMRGETLELEAEKIIINTGSRPIIPNIPGVQTNPRVYTSESLMEETVLPRRLVILGGGYIGLEFASIYRSFGSEVTVIDHGEQLLPREDEDIAREIQTVLEEKGIRFLTQATATAIETKDEEAVLHYEMAGRGGGAGAGGPQALATDAILLATGRKPNTSDLKLEAAGVALTERGAIQVDDQLRTNIPTIWALGDVIGREQFTYISLDDSRIVAPQLKGEPSTYDLAARNNVPYSLFIDPPYARVGLNETSAKAQGLHFTTVTLPVPAIPKAQVLRETDGVLKALVDKDTGVILGAMLFCAEAHELINIVKLAMDANLPYTFLRDQIFTHPTMAESLNDLFGLV